MSKSKINRKCKNAKKENPLTIDATVNYVDIKDIRPEQAIAMRKARQMFERWFTETEEKVNQNTK